MSIGEIISLITLLIGAVLGLSAMFSPAWASRFVLLVEDPDPLRPGGYSEFRATYGGLFLFSHLMTAILLVNLGGSEPEILTSIVVLPLAAGWVGAGVGRLMSRILDRIKNREPGMIPVWIVFEIIFGLAIAAPFIQSLL